MGFLLKSSLGIIIIVGLGGFLINKIPSWKERVIEIFNPAVKEARILGEVEENLDSLDASLATLLSSGASATEKAKINQTKKLLAESKTLLGEVAKINENKPGLIGSTIGRIIEKIIDRTPFPADHLPSNNLSRNSNSVPENCR